MGELKERSPAVAGTMAIADIDDDFRMNDDIEIGAVLSDIAWLGTALTIHTQSGATVDARVLCADLPNHRLLLERGMQAVDEQALTVSAVNRFHGAIRGAPVVFQTGMLRKTKHRGRLAFEVPFPASLYYVQRRRHFRAAVSADAGFTCVLPLGTGVSLRTTIVDLSLSGVRLRGPAGSVLALAKGAEVRAASMHFGALGQLHAHVKVMGCWLADTDDANGAHYGCAFLDLPFRAENMLQRIVTSLELQAANRALVLGAPTRR